MINYKTLKSVYAKMDLEAKEVLDTNEDASILPPSLNGVDGKDVVQFLAEMVYKYPQMFSGKKDIMDQTVLPMFIGFMLGVSAAREENEEKEDRFSFNHFTSDTLH